MCTNSESRYGCWLVFTNVLKLVIYVADVVSDIVLAAKYFNNGDTYWGGFTLAFALVPQFFMNMTMWYQEGRNPRTFILYFLQVGVVLRYLQVVVGVCCRCYNPSDIRKDKEKAETSQKPVSRTVLHVLPLVHLISTLLESVPQICLQLYVVIVTGELERMEIDPLKYVSVVISLVAAVKTVWDWEMHFFDVNPNPPRRWCLLYGPLFAVWKVVELCSRVVAFCVFSSLYSYGGFVVVGVHWLVMAITENVLCSYFRDGDPWIGFYDDIYYDSGTFMQVCFNLLTVSPVDVFAWATFGSRSFSKIQPIVNGVLTFAGNYVMVLVWYFLKDASAWYDLYALIPVLVGTATSLLILKPLYLWCYARGPCNAVPSPEPKLQMYFIG
ncbi:PREDICTED: XK-related protein 6-like [Branchiostoma belcheri]|uniref:XK-related protein n=1 Tax=Branchiostoma belcheri TaxID=7741 RepID=A0A6P4Z9A8_BRABE|nr:PREDICTED: XK-related protein 6-like [Branchiostoma belcheri]